MKHLAQMLWDWHEMLMSQLHNMENDPPSPFRNSKHLRGTMKESKLNFNRSELQLLDTSMLKEALSMADSHPDISASNGFDGVCRQ